MDESHNSSSQLKLSISNTKDGKTAAGRKGQDTALSSSNKQPRFTVGQAIDKLRFGPFQMMLYFFCGLIWLADAMEVMILSIISPAVKCQWSLSNAEEALITSIVFIGSFLGSLFWGFLGDNFGRKIALLCLSLVILVSGILSSQKITSQDKRIPGYPWLLLCRFGVGFGAAGITQVSTYFIEFLPRKTRAICSVCLAGWWAVGTMFGAVLAVGVMGESELGWHWYLGLSNVPIAIAICIVPFVPESAHLLMSKGKKEKALNVLKKIAWLNFATLPEGELTLEEDEGMDKKAEAKQNGSTFNTNIVKAEESAFVESYIDAADGFVEVSSSTEKQPLLPAKIQALKMRSDDDNVSRAKRLYSRICDGFKKFPQLYAQGMWKTTLPLLCLWFGCAWLYYGVVLLTTTMLRDDPHCSRDNVSNSSVANSLKYIFDETNQTNGTATPIICEDNLETSDYLVIMWTSGAELPGLLLTILIIEIIGRKLTMAVNFSIALIGFCLLLICTGIPLMTFFFFIVRASCTGVFQTMYAYTPEVYPTDVRGIGIGFASAVSRIGAIVTPYVAQVLFPASKYATIGLYAGTCLVLAVMALILPIETKGRSLKA